MDVLVVLLIVLLILSAGGGWWTSRPGWSGPEVGGFVWLLCAVLVIVLVVKLLGAV